MKTLAGWWRTGRFQLRLAVLALMFGGSSCTFGDWKTDGYPAQLGLSLEPNVIIWPGDASGTKFHSIAVAATSTVKDADHAVSFEWPSNLAQSLPAKIGSVSVLLDPKPGVELRAHVSELLSEVERKNPEVITSVTVCMEPVGEIADGKSLIAAVTRLAGAALNQRAKPWLEPVVEFNSPFGGFSEREPTLLVLPNAAAPGEFFVVRGNHSLLPLPENQETEIQSRIIDLGLAGLTDWDLVLFLDPWGTPPEVETSMAALMERSTPQPEPGKYGVARWTRWPVQYAEFTSPQAVRQILQGRLAQRASPISQPDTRP